MARLKLGEILVQRGIINEATLRQALGQQVRFAGQRMRIGQILVEMGSCTWADVARALADQLHVPFTDLNGVDPQIVRLLPQELAQKHRAVPFAHEPGPPEAIRVAFADPADLGAIDAVRFRLGQPLRTSIAAPDAIDRALQKAFGIQVSSRRPLTPLELDVGAMPMPVEHLDPGAVAFEADGEMEIESIAGTMPVAGADFEMGTEGPTRPMTPLPLASEVPAPAAAAGDGFDDLFGPPNAQLGADGGDVPPAIALAGVEPVRKPPAAGGRDVAPQSFDGFSDRHLDGGPAMAVNAPVGVEAAVAIPVTRFPDKRRPDSEPGLPEAVQKLPTLVLSAQEMLEEATSLPAGSVEAAGVAQGTEEPASLASLAERPLTPDELKVVEAIEQLADGALDEPAIKQVKPAQMVAALVRLLIRKGVIQETDFLAELSRK